MSKVLPLKTALTIAGSDSSGGAGIQADLKTFQANMVFGMSVITAVTVQNTKGVTNVQNIDPEIVKGQIEVLFEDIKIDSVKIGMLSSCEIIEAVKEGLFNKNMEFIVLDPVMISKSGFLLIAEDAVEKMKKELFPISFIVTPNIHEASKITGRNIENLEDMKNAAKSIFELGPENVFVKGGHLRGEDCTDVLYDGKNFFYFNAKRLDTKNTHGTGCTLSSAIAANLAKGETTLKSLENSKEYITGAIENSISLGHGCGPTHHFFNYYKWQK
ncbi:MAG: bifunctional hydroxymethylpyrimidine kinase/phosphomethylpyrimidine kinase [Desulfobacteraceae bacterium]|nr:bifunctional hydroxymethylpyrimidine kinase/phosphomethylpyrimidine kinase [Desulfobacteraceae bacterium]